MSMDMSKYLGLFVSESIEHLEALGRDLVSLEQAKGPEAVDSMFRHAHSVKGMAASMGFDAIAVLAHRVEDLVDGVRSDPNRLDRDLVDLLLAATDALMAHVRSAGEGSPPADAGPVLELLSARLAATAGRPPPEAPAAPAEPPPASSPVAAPPVPAAPLGQHPRLSVRVRIAPGCQVPGVRAFLLHKKLSALGTVVEVRPALEDLKAGRIPDGLIQAEVETSAGEEALGQALGNVAEVEVLSIKAVERAAPAVEPPKAPAPADSGRTVRVRTELLDYFLDAVGELLLATARIREVGKVLPEHARPPLEEGVYRLHALVKDLHDKVMSIRMTPLSVITERLPRAARDIARKRDREVDLLVTGAEIELDRAIIDELGDPMLHLLRNCIDHGLEPPEERERLGKPARGRLLITVRRSRDRVIVELEDDGQGMDPAKLRAAAVKRGSLSPEAAARLSDPEALMLCCLPGVSTAKDVSDISGRGVGMDAVKRVIENVGGELEIESERGRGTRFTLRLPLTVAVVNLLLVRVGPEVLGLPIAKVLGAVEVSREALSWSRDHAMLAHGAGLLPVHDLSELLGFERSEPASVRPYVVMEAETGRVALGVDQLLGQEEVVLKPLSRPLDLVPGLSGVTILGSGRPIFILDVPRLLSA